MIIRECREQDLASLEEHLPSPGQNRFHEQRFGRQQQGMSTFVIALDGGVPVGAGELRWNGCAAEEVAARFPACPELNGLSVKPERQSQGIGTAIIVAAERAAAQRGCGEIGLGVDDHNHRAAALYLRLGYRETGCHYIGRYEYVDDDGVRHEAADPCRFLVKQLAVESGDSPETA